MSQAPVRTASPAPDLEHYRELAEQALDLILELDHEGCIAYASPSHRKLLGYSSSELLGNLAFDFLHPDDVAATLALFDQAMDTGTPEDALCRVRKADGSWRWLEFIGSPFTNRRGERRMALIGRDVDDREQALDALRRSERLHRTLVETATCGIIESDAEARFTFVNPAYARMIGLPAEELIGRYVWEFNEPGEEVSSPGELARALQHQPTPERRVARLRTPDGRRLVVEADWNYLRDADGRVSGFVCVVEDVTRREATDAALVESHRYITQIAETSPSILCVFGVHDWSVRWVNSRAVAATGLDAAQLRERGSRILEESVHPDDRHLVAEAVARALRSPDDEVAATEHRVRHVSGWRWVLSRFAVFSRDDAGRPVEMLVSQLDVTEQHLTLDQLRAQEERFRLLAENAGDVIIEFDRQGTLLFLSPSWTTITGHPVRGAVGRNMDDLIHQVMDPGEPLAFEEFVREIFDSGSDPVGIYRIHHADGSPRWLEARTRLFRTADGDTRGMAIIRDVTDRVRTEEALRASEARFRQVAESLYDFIVEVSPEGEVAYISPSFREILGFDPARYSVRDAALQLHPEDRERVFAEMQRLIAGHPIGPLAFRQRDAQGRWRWLESHGTPRPTADGRFGGVVITRDVSERVRAEDDARALQAQLLQSQKLESLGVLAGGIAHDFNNLLVGILGNASLALADLTPDSPLYEAMQGIETAALRAGELTNQMLAYSGKGRFVVEMVDMNALVAEMANLLEASISKKARLELDLDPQLPAVEGDASQLRQVVMNLITNASDALGDEGGSIRLRTQRVPNASEIPLRSRIEEPMAPGPAVLLEVVDTGRGMDEATAQRIFDPFFTTKFTGRGLGLAAALGIVRGHRGAIDVRSGVEAGTSFRILLPAGEPRTTLPEQVPACAPREAVRAQGTVLVADDEEVVLAMARRILEQAGFEVITARDGREAVDVFRRWGDRIAVVLLDLTMPRLSGEEALRLLRDECPDVPVVLTSGYAESEIATRFEGVPLEGFLQKPFRPAELVDRIRAALEK
jgi:PAS domain S-box-containing protein